MSNTEIGKLTEMVTRIEVNIRGAEEATRSLGTRSKKDEYYIESTAGNFHYLTLGESIPNIDDWFKGNPGQSIVMTEISADRIGQNGSIKSVERCRTAVGIELWARIVGQKDPVKISPVKPIEILHETDVFAAVAFQTLLLQMGKPQGQ